MNKDVNGKKNKVVRVKLSWLCFIMDSRLRENDRENGNDEVGN